MTPARFLDNILSDLHQGSTIRVLLVEDDSVDAERVYRILNKTGEFSLQHVMSLAKAIPIISGADVDLILLDLNLSDCSSLNAIPALRALTPAPIVVLSGADEGSGVRSAALLNGADTFISKSFNLEGNLRWSIHAAIRGGNDVAEESLNAHGQ